MATKADAWERTVDLVVRRVTYSAAAGACAAVVLFRTPGARQPRLRVCVAVWLRLTLRALGRSYARRRVGFRCRPWCWQRAHRCGCCAGRELSWLRAHARAASEAVHLQKDVEAR